MLLLPLMSTNDDAGAGQSGEASKRPRRRSSHARGPADQPAPAPITDAQHIAVLLGQMGLVGSTALAAPQLLSSQPRFAYPLGVRGLCCAVQHYGNDEATLVGAFIMAWLAGETGQVHAYLSGSPPANLPSLIQEWTLGQCRFCKPNIEVTIGPIRKPDSAIDASTRGPTSGEQGANETSPQTAGQPGFDLCLLARGAWCVWGEWGGIGSRVGAGACMHAPTNQVDYAPCMSYLHACPCAFCSQPCKYTGSPVLCRSTVDDAQAALQEAWDALRDGGELMLFTRVADRCGAGPGPGLTAPGGLRVCSVACGAAWVWGVRQCRGLYPHSWPHSPAFP